MTPRIRTEAEKQNPYAAQEAEGAYEFDSWDDEDSAPECEKDKATAGYTIAKLIRQLADDPTESA